MSDKKIPLTPILRKFAEYALSLTNNTYYKTKLTKALKFGHYYNEELDIAPTIIMATIKAKNSAKALPNNNSTKINQLWGNVKEFTKSNGTVVKAHKRRTV